ncbi:LysR family transcriptional regulator [Bordetella ansorpii]|nr:LysR family transcriptional regulator [Bordetella ansorpii]
MKREQMPYTLSASDLHVVLALVRGGTLARASERLGIAGATVFRAVQRIESGLGQRLFERSRAGYQPTELGAALAEQAEAIALNLEAAQSIAQGSPEQVSGSVNITTTDAVLHGLVASALKPLDARHPRISYVLHTGNEIADLVRHDADIAIRATKDVPVHLIGKHLGAIQVALFASREHGPIEGMNADQAAKLSWIAPDDALPGHPSVVWRKRQFPKIRPKYRVNSILTVMELVALGMGVGILPTFLVRGRNDLLQLTDIIKDSQTELWLLMHRESRHRRRVSAVFEHLHHSLGDALRQP